MKTEPDSDTSEILLLIEKSRIDGKRPAFWTIYRLLCYYLDRTVEYRSVYDLDEYLRWIETENGTRWCLVDEKGDIRLL